jgi:hypothetical protein
LKKLETEERYFQARQLGVYCETAITALKINNDNFTNRTCSGILVGGECSFVLCTDNVELVHTAEDYRQSGASTGDFATL